MTDAQIAELHKLSNEARALSDSKRIITEGERELLNLVRRVIEVLSDGKPITQPITRHHA